MFVFLKKIEFYKDKSDREAIVIAAEGAEGGGGDCESPQAVMFFHYGGPSLPPNFSPPHEILSSPYFYVKWGDWSQKIH